MVLRTLRVSRALLIIALATASVACLHAAEYKPLEDPRRPVATTQSVPPSEAAQRMSLPPGFHVQLVAAEPDIVQPIAYAIDDRGRIWLLENTNYPECPGQPKDRIVILDQFGPDGKAGRQTVFYDKLTFASGIAVVHGGVWVGAPPNLLFIPVKQGDDHPAGEPQVVLDGWGNDDRHETLNSFTWGPDGWLYGTQGIFTVSHVGKPGTPESERTYLDGGVWRYHPLKKRFEVYAEGASNQWGVDWDDWGQAYFEACVIPHMWQCIQGARYQRQAGQHPNKFTYDDIKTIADFEYEKRAYCGAMVYLGGQWPAEYRNTFFFNDIHMNKMRNEQPVRSGSGAKSERRADFLVPNDPWYRGLTPQYGPDGSVFVNDWYDKVPCYQQRDYVDRSNGRLYKIVYGDVPPVTVDLQRASDAELVQAQLNPNDWYVRHARRILQERGPNPEVQSALTKILRENPDETRQLRALWALHGINGLTDEVALENLKSPHEFVRAWTIQLTCEDGTPSAPLLDEFARLAREDSSPVVRMYLASSAQRIEVGKRWPIVTALVARGEDADDHNLPLMTWYAAEPAIGADLPRGADLLAQCRIGKVREFIARRIATEAEPASPKPLDLLVRALGRVESPEAQASILRGMNASLQGRHGLSAPEGWDDRYDKLRQSPNEEVRRQAQALAVALGTRAALAEMRQSVVNASADSASRQAALASLLAAKDAQTLPLLLDLVKQPGPLRQPALHGLAEYEDPQIAGAVLAVFQALDTADKRAALDTLVGRPASAREFLSAIDAGKLPRAEISQAIARQLQDLHDSAVDAWLTKNWGAIRTSPADKQAQIARMKKFLSADSILKADVSRGRAIFTQTCAMCHTLFGYGAKIGPELPGSFEDVDYLLLNIVDPDAIIGKDYLQVLVHTKDDQTLSGIIAADDPNSVTLKSLAGLLTIQRSDIASMEVSPHSLMPEGLITSLDQQSVRDLFLYLRQQAQVPILATSVNAADFFNGSDLARWQVKSGDWKIENGELVGRAGLQQTAVLLSDMVADSFDLTMQVQLRGSSPVAELAFWGRADLSPFRGWSLSLGGIAPPNLWLYNPHAHSVALSPSRHVSTTEWAPFQVECRRNHLTASFGDRDFIMASPPPGTRSVFAFYLRGGDAELRVKDIKLNAEP